MLNATRTFLSRTAASSRGGSAGFLSTLGHGLDTQSVQICRAAAIRHLSSTPTFAHQQYPTNVQGARFFSDKKVVDIRRSEQQGIWDEYISSGKGAEIVFESIDLNHNGTISVQEVNYFLDSVGRKGLTNEGAIERMQQLGADHEMDMTEFMQLLNLATDESAVIGDPLKETEAPKEEEKPKPKRKLVDARRSFQKLVWDEHLATGKHGEDLFIMIDLNKNKSISVSEITFFLDSVDKEGVKAEEFDKLIALGEDHELNEEEFLAWLKNATN